jgi:hypothetical protein
MGAKLVAGLGTRRHVEETHDHLAPGIIPVERAPQYAGYGGGGPLPTPAAIPPGYTGAPITAHQQAPPHVVAPPGFMDWHATGRHGGSPGMNAGGGGGGPGLRMGGMGMVAGMAGGAMAGAGMAGGGGGGGGGGMGLAGAAANGPGMMGVRVARAGAGGVVESSGAHDRSVEAAAPPVLAPNIYYGAGGPTYAALPPTGLSADGRGDAAAPGAAGGPRW